MSVSCLIKYADGVVVATLALTCLAQSGVRPKRLVPLEPDVVKTFQSQGKIALLIGIGAYSEASGFSRLRYPAKDVAALAAEFDQQGYAVRVLVDGDATRGVIRKTLKELADSVGPSPGSLLVYFSGHGFEQDKANFLAVFGSVADDLKGEGLAL